MTREYAHFENRTGGPARRKKGKRQDILLILETSRLA